MDLRVTVMAREMVAAALPLQEHWLPLSNLDLLLPPLDVGVFFCYHSNGTSTFGEKASILKKALAESLVSFYALAGEVVENSAGEPEILCNNRGVEFVEASALDVEVRELDLYHPDHCAEGKLVPKKKHGVLCVQATELKCGGMVLGCTFDHRVADAYSANMFFVAWARTATSSFAAAANTTPSFRRSLLNPRYPLSSVDPSIDDLYVPYSSLPPPPPPTATMISRIYHLPAAELSNLQTAATKPTNEKLPSKLQTVSAYLWKLLAQHVISQTQDDDVISTTCKLGIVVDGRQRLGPDMSSYFGNVLSVPFARLGASELASMPLADVAEVVGQFVAAAANKEHFMGLVDWVEAHRPEPAVAKAYVEGVNVVAEPGFVVSSGQRFPVTQVDFGWGGPVFGSYHFPWGGSTGYVMPMPSPNGNNDWIVYMHLIEAQLDFIEEKASHVFAPFALKLVTSCT